MHFLKKVANSLVGKGSSSSSKKKPSELKSKGESPDAGTKMSPDNKKSQTSSHPRRSREPEATEEYSPRESARIKKREPTRKKSQSSAPPPVKVETPKQVQAPKVVFKVEPKEGFTRFQDLKLPDEVMHGIGDLGFQYCTPIQAQILPHILEGKDASGRAQTGTGKTAAFLLAILNHVLKNPLQENQQAGTPRALVIAPTRELVVQIEEEAHDLAKYCKVTILAVFGGMGYEQQRESLKAKDIDLVVATPGRLLDFKNKHVNNLQRVEIMVIDEADRMLDMGFIPDVRKIILSTAPKDQRQTMLFSATLTPEVTRLVGNWTRDPVKVEIEPEQVASDMVDQKIFVTTTKDKFALLYNLLNQREGEPVIVFANRRDSTQDLTDQLSDHGIHCALLSGAVHQKKRMSTLEKFKQGEIPVLVATDVAGRGLHIEGVTHVINYNLPHDPEDYVHRIGRTGRAGTKGTSISFACEEDSFYIPEIEKYMGLELECTHPSDELLKAPPEPVKTRRSRPPEGRGGKKFSSSRPQGRHQRRSSSR